MMMVEPALTYALEKKTKRSPLYKNNFFHPVVSQLAGIINTDLIGFAFYLYLNFNWFLRTVVKEKKARRASLIGKMIN